MMARAPGPREALFEDGQAARALPVCDHYSGVEPRMRKSLVHAMKMLEN